MWVKKYRPLACYCSPYFHHKLWSTHTIHSKVFCNNLKKYSVVSLVVPRTEEQISSPNASPRAFYCTKMCKKSKWTTFSYYESNTCYKRNVWPNIPKSIFSERIEQSTSLNFSVKISIYLDLDKTRVFFCVGMQHTCGSSIAVVWGEKGTECLPILEMLHLHLAFSFHLWKVKVASQFIASFQRSPEQNFFMAHSVLFSHCYKLRCCSYRCIFFSDRAVWK